MSDPNEHHPYYDYSAAAAMAPAAGGDNEIRMEDETTTASHQQHRSSSSSASAAAAAADNNHKNPNKQHKRRFCRAQGCTRIVKSQGLCQGHGAKPRGCKVTGCSKQAQGNFDGMCSEYCYYNIIRAVI